MKEFAYKLQQDTIGFSNSMKSRLMSNIQDNK